MSNEPTITAWVTKYALSMGIECIQGEITRTGALCMKNGGDWHWFATEGKDWHRTPEAAVARAEAMRVAKLASLAKRIVKLQRVVFAAPNAGDG